MRTTTSKDVVAVLLLLLVLVAGTTKCNAFVVADPLSSSSSSPTTSTTSASFLATTTITPPWHVQPARKKSRHHQPLLLSPRRRDEVAVDASTSTTTTTTTSTTATAAAILDPWESWCLSRLVTTYQRALQIKCPFLRRRASDALDGLEMVLRFLVVRHKSLDLLGPPVGWRLCQGKAAAVEKEMFLSSAQVMERIRADWKPDNHKGYYITGRLSTELYRDDCFFDGPDPDMPVRGLRKYLNAASQLFETQSSIAELLDLQHDVETDLITARWRIKGVLHLPWRPTMPEWTGTTTYHRDDNGLIYKHVETWNVSVLEAFLQTLWPELAERIWSPPPRVNG